MSEVKITHYNPRQDKEELLQLIKNFEYRVGEVDLDVVSKELDHRANDLKLRNSIILAKEDEKLVGAGFITMWSDYLGRSNLIVHDIVTEKENAFKKGIEEKILRELFKYFKNILKINQFYMYARKKGDINIKSIMMKLGIKAGEIEIYFKTL